MNLINDTMIGIDVSKEKLDIYISATQVHQQIDNQAKVIRKFFKTFNLSIKKIVLEHTGGYENVCVKILHELNIPVHVAHPSQVHYFAKAKKYLAKTDKIDAKILALFAEEASSTPSEAHSAEDEELKALTKRKEQLTDMLTKEKMRAAGPNAIGEMGRSLRRFIKQIQTEIKFIDKKLQEGIKKNKTLDEKVTILSSFKGIGEASAILLAVTMPELGTVNKAAAASLCGLAPVNHDSGRKSGYRSIKGGRFGARTTLYMCALSAIRWNWEMKTFYQRLKARGKKSKVAIVAVMRKMVITINALLKNKTLWISKMDPLMNT